MSNPTPREFAKAEYGFTGTRGRLPKNVLDAYAAKYGEFVKPKATAKVKTEKATEVKVQVADNGPDWKMGELADRDEAEVIELLSNRKIMWRNEGTNSIESATVRNPKIETASSGRKIVTFNRADGAFQSVALVAL